MSVRSAPTPPAHRLAALLALATFVPCALAQSAYQPPYANPTPFGALERVDPGIADIGPLNTSARVLPTDLRLPVGFEHVYRVRGDNNTLLRVSGGLAATFPRSQYNTTRDGLFPQIPAGTVFHIGGVRSLSASDTMTLHSTPAHVPAFNAIDRNASGASPVMRTSRSIDSQATLADTRTRTPTSPNVAPSQPSQSPQPPQRPDAEPDPANIWNDEVYRALRVRQLLLQASAD